MASVLPRLPATVRSNGHNVPQTVVLPQPSMLPKQPGNNWEDAAFKKSHSRRQALRAEGAGDFGGYKSTYVRSTRELPKPEVGLETQRLEACLLNTASGSDSPQKKSVVEDCVLRFFGYWTEIPVQSTVETNRVRKVTLCFYPEDETVMLSEPRAANSGIQGGTLLKRRKVPMHRDIRAKKPEDSENLSIDDLTVGGDVQIHGKKIHLCDCDQFTRKWYAEMGVEMPPGEPTPDDQYFTEYRAKRIDAKRPQRTYEDFDLRMSFEQQSKGRVVKHYPNEIQRVRKFLQDGGKVCRFWAFWNDEKSPHGDLRKYEVRYFIEDDSVEIVERLPPNSGREQSRAFCRRARLPREETQQRKGLELTFAARMNGITHSAPSDGKTESDCFYVLGDMKIGSKIKAYGRELEIFSADAWTREYLQGLGMPLEEERPYPGNKTKEPTVIIPAKHNGYGTEEDSLGNCHSLVLKAPKQDLKRWQKHADDVQRFKLKLHDPVDANDIHRRFVLTFFMSDDTLTINEASIRNSGFLAGRFLKRQRVKKFKAEGSASWLSGNDFVPGAVVNISGHVFEVIEMDKRTETLKDTSLQVPREVTPERVAELGHQLRRALLTKHMTHTEAFRHYDRDRDGLIGLHEFKTMLSSLHMDHVQEPEVVAIMQQWNTNRDGKLSLNEFVTGVTGNTLKSFLDGEDAEFGKVDSLGADASPYHSVAAERPRDNARSKILRTFKATLEARQINVFEMYRMLSTMPAAYSTTRTGVKGRECLASGGDDSLLGPVQLRRGVEERFNLGLNEEELDDLVRFFFPTIPKELMKAPRSQTEDFRLSLADFQEKWNALELLGQLPPSDRLDAHALSQF
eukprot:Hpha_TRINITY_DN15245_c1_g2::TRINITY_DN15245_c1_g2_i1::g.68489::m.68489